jgi:autotransporter-associated beta strand protein
MGLFHWHRWLRRWGKAWGVKARPRRAPRRRPRLEILEDRLAPATLTWNGSQDGNWNTKVGEGGVFESNWTNSDGTNTGAIPQSGDQLFFPLGKPNESNTNNISGLSVQSITFGSGSGSYSISGNSLSVTGNITDQGANPIGSTFGNTLALPLVLPNTITVTVSQANEVLQVSGQISQPSRAVGGITKTGPGELGFGPASSNTYTGTTQVNQGLLFLNETNAVVGPLVIGPANGGTAASVNINTSGVTAGNVSVTVNSSGALDVNGDDTIGALTLNGGSVTIFNRQLDIGTTPNTLTLNGDVTTNASSTTAAIGGPGLLSLGASSRRFTVAHGTANPDLNVSVTVEDGVNASQLVKAGAGRMVLSAANSYGGGTDVQAGELNVQGNSALGAGSATVETGAALEVQAPSAGANLDITNAITLNGSGVNGAGALDNVGGTNVLEGDITLASNSALGVDVVGDFLTLADRVTGPGGLTKVGAGTLALMSPSTGAAANSYGGGTQVDQGLLDLEKVGAIQGALTVGTGSSTTSAQVVLGVAAATSSNTAVTVNRDGLFAVGKDASVTAPTTPLAGIFGGSDTIAALALNGGTVDIAGAQPVLTPAGLVNVPASVLALGGDVMVNAAAATATIQGGGTLSLGGANRTFTVAGGGADPGLAVSATVADGVPVTAPVAPGGTSAGGLTLTSAGMASGFTLSTFATGFPLRSDGAGPFSAVLPGSGGVLVSDVFGEEFLFPTDTDGQNVTNNARVGAFNEAQGIVKLGNTLYTTTGGSGNGVAQLNDDGSLNHVVASNIPSALGIAADPRTGHLFVSSYHGAIYEVDPVAGTATVFSNVESDGLAFDATANTLYAVGVGDPSFNQHVVGFDASTGAMVFDSGSIPGQPDGMALGAGSLAGNLFVNTNGGTLVEINLATLAQTVLASGGSRGDFVTVDPSNGTLFVAESSLLRLIPPAGAGFVGGSPAELTKAGAGRMVVSGSNTYSGGTHVTAGELNVQSNAGLGSGPATVDAGTAAEVQAPGLVPLVVPNPLTLNGSGVGETGALRNITGANALTGTITLATDSVIGVDADGLDLRSQVSGAGGLTKVGAGSLTLDNPPSGAAANTYGGPTQVDAGLLVLAKAGAVPGTLTVGTGTGTPAQALLTADAATALATAVTVNSDGLFAVGEDGSDAALAGLQGSHSSDTVASLALNGGAVNIAGPQLNGQAPASVLTLGGDVTTTASGTTAKIGGGKGGGTLSLGGSTRTFTVPDGTADPDLDVSATVADGGASAGLTKAGPGDMELGATDSYTGTTQVNAGTLTLRHASAVVGSLVVGDASAVARIAANNATAPAVPVTVNATGEVDVGGMGAAIQDTIRSLTFNGGTVNVGGSDTVTSTLTLGGDVTATMSAAPATIMGSGDLSLGGANRTFTVAGGGADPGLVVSAAIVDGTATNTGGTTMSPTRGIGISSTGDTTTTLSSPSSGGSSAGSLTLTPAGMAAIFHLSTFADSFPTNGSGSTAFGPVGIAFPGGGKVLVSDFPGNVRVFPTDTDGQHASGVPAAATYGSDDAVGIAQSGGAFYMTQVGAGEVVQINADGTFKQNIAAVPEALGIVTNPANGHLLVASFAGSIYDVDPVAKTANVFISNVPGADGLSIAPDGSVVYAAAEGAGGGGHILGYRVSDGTMVFDSGDVGGEGLDGTALGSGSLAGNIFANTNDGRVLEINLTTKVETVLASGGSRGDFVSVDPTNGTLLLTQSDLIARLIPPPGGGFVGGGSGGGGSGLTKAGAGRMVLSGNNLYSGGTDVTAGEVNARSNTALGTGPATVEMGAALELQPAAQGPAAIGLANDLTLNGTGVGGTGALRSIAGNNTVSGTITLHTDSAIGVDAGGSLGAEGAIGGQGGLTKVGPGSLEVSGSAADSYGGPTAVNAGSLALAKNTGVLAVPHDLTIGNGTGPSTSSLGSSSATSPPTMVSLVSGEQIADGARVTVASDGILKINFASETIGSLAGSGLVQFASGSSTSGMGSGTTSVMGSPSSTLSVGADNTSTTYAGTIAGSSVNFVKIGGGTVTLTGASPFGGTTSVNGGKLLVDGSLAGPVVVNSGGTLAGHGSVGPTTVNGGGTVAPGDSPGILSVQGGVTFGPGSVLFILVNGPAAGSGYSQLSVSGPVVLNGPALRLTFGFAPAPGQDFVFIAHGGSGSGAFAGMPEDALLAHGTSFFDLSYAAGGGVDALSLSRPDLFVRALFADFDAPSSRATRSPFEGRADGGESRLTVARDFLVSPARRVGEVRLFYSIFGLSADSHQTGFIAELIRGVPPGQVLIDFLTSRAFTRRHRSNASFLRALFKGLLGNAAGRHAQIGHHPLGFYLQELNAGTVTRGGLVRQLLATDEVYAAAIRQNLATFLGTVPSPAQVQTLAGQLLSGGLTPDQLTESIVALDSYVDFFVTRAAGGNAPGVVLVNV